MPKAPRQKRRVVKKSSYAAPLAAVAAIGVLVIVAVIVLGPQDDGSILEKAAAEKSVVDWAAPRAEAEDAPSLRTVEPSHAEAASEPKAPVIVADEARVSEPKVVEAVVAPEPEPVRERLPDIDSPLQNVTCSWLGNTFPHGRGGNPSEKWVPQNATDICVTPDGTVFTNVYWEEGGANNTQIKDGEVVNQGHGSHGWGHQGGDAVAANSKYMYAGHVFDNEGGGLKGIVNWPPKGKIWYGVSRRNRADIRRGNPFEGGKGGKESPPGCFLVVHEVAQADNATIRGLYATEDELFVSCPHDDKVRVYDANTMALKREFAAEDPEYLAMDRAGRLWIISADGTRVLRYTTDGKRLSQSIALPAGSKASDICVDSKDRLLIADNGERAQILIVEGLNARPHMKAPFGVKGGVFAGRPQERGRVGDLRFHAITGVGADSNGNTYVASSCSPFSGLRLESYSSSGKLNWRASGLEFVSRACEDPVDDTSVYSQGVRYKLDYSKPAGREWSCVAITYDGKRFPDDPGLCSPLMRSVGGKKLNYACGQNSAMPMGIYRFEPDAHGETAIPCGLFMHRPDKGKPNTPQDRGWIWIDANGDGQFDAKEFASRGKEEPGAGGYWVDDRGDIWFASGGVMRYAFQGFNGHGVPLYDFDHLEMFAKPQPFQEVKRIRYDRKRDVMYLGGTTTEHKNRHWKGMGPVLCRYDDWSKGNREPRWTVVGTYDRDYGGGHVSCEPLSFDIAGEYVFVALAGQSHKLGIGWAHVDVYELLTGRKVGWMEPSSEIGQVGLMDMVECLRAFRRSDGEYIIFEEEDYAAKNLMYRWRP